MYVGLDAKPCRAVLQWMRWHQFSPVLLAGAADGNSWMWRIPAGDCKTYQGHGCACNVGRVLPDGKKAVMGYEDGAVKLWNLRDVEVMHSITGKTATTRIRQLH